MTSTNEALIATIPLLSTALVSSIVLAVQLRLHRKNEEQQPPRKVQNQDVPDPSYHYTTVKRDFMKIICALLLFAIWAFTFAWRVSRHERLSENAGDDNETFLLFALSALTVALTWIYALAISVAGLRSRKNFDLAWIYNCHLCVLTTIAFIFSLYQLRSALLEQSDDASDERIDQTLAICNTIMCTIIAAIALTTPQGPPLVHNGRPLDLVVSCSVLDFFTFSFLNPVVTTGLRNPKMKDSDIPELRPFYRSINVYASLKNFHNSNHGVIYKLIKTNMYFVIMQVGYGIVGSALYYSAPFFLNRLLIYISLPPSEKEAQKQLAYLCLFGMFASSIITAFTASQLLYWSSAMMVRCRAMLNSDIYMKTLKRRDLSISTANQAPKTSDNTNAEDTDDKKDKKDKDSKSEDEDLSSTGTIVNLMSTDSSRIADFSMWWFSLYCAPIELCVGIFFLYQLLGWSCILGLVVMIFTIPANKATAKGYTKTQEQLMEARDKRVSLMNEILQGVRQIKFFAWEREWEKKIMASRDNELIYLRLNLIYDILFNFLWQGSPIFVTILSFYSFTKLAGHELDAPTAFTAITVFNELRFAFNVLPETFVEMLQALVSIRRIEKYMNEEEILFETPSEIKLGFKDATISWDVVKSATAEIANSENGKPMFSLKDVDLDFPIGELSVVCGATGSGKTLLLLALLGETRIEKGEAFCPRAPIYNNNVDEEFDNDTPQAIEPDKWILDTAVAYVSQTAWLQNASIRDNITFGLPLDKARYKAVLEQCALEKDLEIFEDGDETEIGEKGITLSGGQKQRVSLARALYSRARHILMDDVLSAVDAHTARHIYEHCLMGPLMANRTRILVTHQVRLTISGAAYLVIIKNGKISLSGNPALLRQAGTLQAALSDVDQIEKDNTDTTSDSANASISTEETMVSSEDEGNTISVEIAETAQEENQKAKKKKVMQLVEDEEMVSGSVKWSVYKAYFKELGRFWYWLLLILIFLTNRGLNIAEGWWIKEWSSSYETHKNSTNFLSSLVSLPRDNSQYQKQYGMNENTFTSFIHGNGYDFTTTLNDKDDELNYFLAIYMLISVAQIIANTSQFIWVYYGSLKASKHMYYILLQSVLRAPLRFFDTTPVGRILNRFAKDFETIDSRLPNDMAFFYSNSTYAIIVFIICASVTPIFLIPAFCLSIIYIYIGYEYAAASRQLKRMESNSKSPQYSHFTETIIGVVTIRAFGSTKRFMNEMLIRIDKNSKPFYYVWTLNRWLSVRFNIIGAFVAVSSGTFILMNPSIDASLAGFTLSFALRITDTMLWVIRRYTSLELSLNSVERYKEFVDMPQEKPAIVEPRPPAAWPYEGAIHVDGLVVKYAPDLQPVLHGLNLNIKSQEKIGIVGRTGSGKSTLALSFFRFIEPTEGRIIIDDIDITSIGLEDLRSRLTIIPQDPTLFSGTLRSNLDPFNHYEDIEIFESLRRVQLLESSSETTASSDTENNANVFRNLEITVTEGGKNFSQGQRQLLCLARALLKQTKIVLMDEATASVDFETDEAIQRTIRNEFSFSTVLCIAHRLMTVIDYDRILVLDHGRVVDFDTPYALISNPETSFYKMCKNSGEFDLLLKLAKKKEGIA